MLCNRQITLYFIKYRTKKKHRIILLYVFLENKI